MKPALILSLLVGVGLALYCLPKLPDQPTGYPVLDLFWSLAIVLTYLAIYMTPTIVGVARSVPNVGSITVINLLLGWTVIGWVVALAMAARDVPQAQEA